MAKRTITTPWRTLTADVEDPSDNGFTPVSAWMDASSVVAARCNAQMRSLIGNFEGIPAVQTANSERGTLTVTNLGSTWIDANGYADQSDDEDLSSVTDGQQLLRLGFVTRSSSGTDLCSAELTGAFVLTHLDTAPPVRMPWTTVMSNSTSASFFPATDWLDSTTVVQMRCAFEVRGINGVNLQLVPAYQTADDPTSPDAATGFGATATANGITYPTAWQAPSAIASKRVVRFGWLAVLSTGSTLSWARMSGVIQRLTES